jgi:hypothetical protein
MKQLIYALCLFPVLTLTAGCKNATERLSAFTDIDTAGTNAEVSYIRRDDLDQWGYKILVPKDRENEWQRAIERTSGNWCLRFVLDGSGCHYNTKAGHNVFLERTSPLTYVIYTSG